MMPSRFNHVFIFIGNSTFIELSVINAVQMFTFAKVRDEIGLTGLTGLNPSDRLNARSSASHGR